MEKVSPETHEALVLDQIEAAGNQLENAKQDRIRAIRLGRAAGIKWTEIGRKLGITDASCIGLIHRADRGE